MSAAPFGRVGPARLLMTVAAIVALVFGLAGTSNAAVSTAATSAGTFSTATIKTATIKTATVSIVTVTPTVHPYGTGSTVRIVVRDRGGHPANGKATFFLDNRAIAVIGLDRTGTAVRQIPAATAIGRHNVRATYQPAGGSSMVASHGGTAFGVTHAQVRWSVVGPKSPVYAGQTAINIRLSGTNVAPATVTLSSGGRVIARQAVPGSGEVLLRPRVSWGAGPATLVIRYSGNSFNAASTRQVSAPTSRTASTTVVTAPATLGFGTGASAQVRISGAGATPGGSVSLSVDDRARNTAPLSGGRATLSIPAVAGGTHALTVVYSGDSNHGASSRRTTVVAAASPCPVSARACIDLTHSITWLQRGGTVIYGPVPMKPGRAGHRTDVGMFAVYYKDLHHYSSEYGGAPMPFSAFFDGGIAFHEGSLTVQSHGCIHLSQAAASTYFNTLAIGDGVYVFGSAPY